ncbi:hypothetical protein BDQ12DRAFT_675047 [Crucibulum laeve]|uniref:RNAse P Rpr2/Rpp21/SNM1 subunit domain-containing protein n=1 Tax=Crucibulum laeve TaxID=68775 RepID=A0A5C3MHQ4_9AGAR|nr:hypothetical protein BDQ12DRAFT_675047 [Crucibulum laeve]
MDPSQNVTARFQKALPYTLLPLSPRLAALHTARARAQPHAASFPDSCSKCGTYASASTSHISVKRMKRSTQFNASSTRVLRRTCRACGDVIDTPLDTGNAALFPTSTAAKGKASRSQKEYTQIPPSLETKSRLPSLTPSASPVPTQRSASMQPTSRSTYPDPSHPIASLNSSKSNPARTSATQPKVGSKKRSGLQDMLSRNRDKEQREQSKNKAGKAGGLAEFLSGL